MTDDSSNEDNRYNGHESNKRITSFVCTQLKWKINVDNNNTI